MFVGFWQAGNNVQLPFQQSKLCQLDDQVWRLNNQYRTHRTDWSNSCTRFQWSRNLGCNSDQRSEIVDKRTRMLLAANWKPIPQTMPSQPTWQWSLQTLFRGLRLRNWPVWWQRQYKQWHQRSATVSTPVVNLTIPKFIHCSKIKDLFWRLLSLDYTM